MTEGTGVEKNKKGESENEQNNRRIIKIAFPEKFKVIGYITIDDYIYINTANMG